MPHSSISPFQRGELGDMPLGVPGQLADALSAQEDAAKYTGLTFNTYTLTIDTAANSTLYSFKAQGETISYTSDASATVDEIAEGLKLAADDNYVLGRLLDITRASGVLTIASTAHSFALQMSTVASAANMTLAETVATGQGTVLPFGEAVYLDTTAPHGDLGTVTQVKPSGAIDDVFRGITIFDGTQNKRDSQVKLAYEPGKIVRVLRASTIYVEGGADAVRGGAVFVGVTTAGSTVRGQFYTTDDGANREELSRASAEWDRPYVIKLKLV